jgi:hypothetical protein
MSRLYVVTPSFTHFRITFSNQTLRNGSPDVDVADVKLTSDIFVETWFPNQCIFGSAVTCAAVGL